LVYHLPLRHLETKTGSQFSLQSIPGGLLQKQHHLSLNPFSHDADDSLPFFPARSAGINGHK